MQNNVLLEIVKQNQYTSSFSFDRITEQNSSLRLNDRTASIGFIYRHIGETTNLFSQFLGIPTDVRNTTMGEIDTGQHFDIDYSRELIERGYKVLEELVENSSEEDWLKPVDTPFFGTVSKENYTSIGARVLASESRWIQAQSATFLKRGRLHGRALHTPRHSRMSGDRDEPCLGQACRPDCGLSESFAVEDYARDGSQWLACGVLRPVPPEDRGRRLPLLKGRSSRGQIVAEGASRAQAQAGHGALGLMVKHLRRGLRTAQIESTLSRMPEPVQRSRETIYTSLYAMPKGNSAPACRP